MASFGPPEILIIAVLVMVLFGARRLPDSARALGRSMRIFKAETKGLRDDDLVSPPTALTGSDARFDAQTGLPLGPPAARFDPQTGEPLGAPAARFDAQTGEPLRGNTDRTS